MNEDDLSFQICKMPDDFKFAEDGRRAVLEGLWRYITSKTSNMEPPRTIPIFIWDRKNRVVGGVIGHVFGGWLYVELLWVEESLRNKGNGTKLLKMVEDEAVKLGCKHAHLDTFSFEAKPFYEKHGYTLFAALDNYPEGHSKHFLRKGFLESAFATVFKCTFSALTQFTQRIIHYSRKEAQFTENCSQSQIY